MKKVLLILIAVCALTACSSDDGDNETTPDSINQTEWRHEESNRTYYIYFSVDNFMSISHPVYDVGSGEFHNEEIDGTFTYDKPNVTISFNGQCNNSGFVFSSCKVSG